MLSAATKPDYEALRLIMQRELGRAVSIEEATGTGDWLLQVYDNLLYNRGEYDKLGADTTHR